MALTKDKLDQLATDLSILQYQRALAMARRSPDFAGVLLQHLPSGTRPGSVVCDLNDLTAEELWALGRTGFPLPPRWEVTEAQLAALAAGQHPAAVFGEG